MKINVGIVGYGNLGKAVEKEILKNPKYNLMAIFSRRIVSSKFNTLVEDYDSHKNYVGKIDLMFLCGGSLSDLEFQSEEIAKHFNFINTFDTHAKIEKHITSLNAICKKSNTVAIVSCGWDPGIFSVVRALMFSISNQKPTTFWGKGISMGHSDAIRRVEGVIDGIQFTIPNKEAVVQARKETLSKNTPKHFRECFVVSHEPNKSKIEKQIKSIPNYFKNQPTTVKFVSEDTLLKLKNKLFHKGEIICTFTSDTNLKNSLNFSVKMQSNPNFTAKIMVAYSNAVINLKNKKISGAFTPLEIPASELFLNKNKLYEFC